MTVQPRATKKRKTDAPAPAKGSSDLELASPGGVALEDDADKYDSGDDSASDDDEVLDDEFADEDDDAEDADDSDADSIDSILAAQGVQSTKKRKRHDADAFATSMSKILASHLTTGARKDPVLVRAKQMSHGADEAKQEAKTKRVQKEEKRKEKERGRIRELVPKDNDAAAKAALEKERALKGIARSGVARLYNAIRAAQVKGEEAAKGAKKEGVVGMGNRDAKVTEMSKQGFLDLIQSSGKAK